MLKSVSGYSATSTLWNLSNSFNPAGEGKGLEKQRGWRRKGAGERGREKGAREAGLCHE
jgi:hypothetical protein